MCRYFVIGYECHYREYGEDGEVTFQCDNPVNVATSDENIAHWGYGGDAIAPSYYKMCEKFYRDKKPCDLEQMDTPFVERSPDHQCRFCAEHDESEEEAVEIELSPKDDDKDGGDKKDEKDGEDGDDGDDNGGHHWLQHWGLAAIMRKAQEDLADEDWTKHSRDVSGTHQGSSRTHKPNIKSHMKGRQQVAKQASRSEVAGRLRQLSHHQRNAGVAQPKQSKAPIPPAQPQKASTARSKDTVKPGKSTTKPKPNPPAHAQSKSQTAQQSGLQKRSKGKSQPSELSQYHLPPPSMIGESNRAAKPKKRAGQNNSNIEAVERE